MDNFHEVCKPEKLKKLNFQYASKLESLVLENNKIEDDFEISDALLLNKFIWHKSCPLKKGVLPSRMAYVMRLIDRQARFSKFSLERTYFLLEATGNDVQSDFGYQLAKFLKDGDIISDNLDSLKKSKNIMKTQKIIDWDNLRYLIVHDRSKLSTKN